MGADDAVALIDSGATVAIGGSGSLLQVPETLLARLEHRFHASAQPRDLQVVHVMGLGDHQGRGVDHLAHDGLVRRFIGSHFALSPRQQDMIREQRVEALAPPAGSISLLYREIAGGRPGLFTDIGLGTYVDPRERGGRINDVPTSPLSRYVEIDGKGWIFYPRFGIDVALLRGTEIDENGNVAMDDEAGVSDNLAIAQAVHNSGGMVIVEVKRVVPAGSIPATQGADPGAARRRRGADRVDRTRRRSHSMTPRRTGRERQPARRGRPAAVRRPRQVVARRALTGDSRGRSGEPRGRDGQRDLLRRARRGRPRRDSGSRRAGHLRRSAGVGLDSGTAINPAAIVDMPSSSTSTTAAPGLRRSGVRRDRRAGDVNVAAAGGKPIGPGGFIDISQKAANGRVLRHAARRRAGPRHRRRSIAHRAGGRVPEVRRQVSYVCFIGGRARRRGQRVALRHRAGGVRARTHGVELVEIAPGVDLDRDVLQQMGFTPLIREPLRLMDAAALSPRRHGHRRCAPHEARRRKGDLHHDRRLRGHPHPRLHPARTGAVRPPRCSPTSVPTSSRSSASTPGRSVEPAAVPRPRLQPALVGDQPQQAEHQRRRQESDEGRALDPRTRRGTPTSSPATSVPALWTDSAWVGRTLSADQPADHRRLRLGLRATGPYVHRRGQDLAAQAISGLMALTGTRRAADRCPPAPS